MREKAALRFVGLVKRTEKDYTYVRIFPEYHDALKGIEEFSHLIILYWIHLCDNVKDRSTLRVIPKRHKGASEMGVFGTRSPSRPNPVGLCVVELEYVEGGDLKVKDLDAYEETPIIDIKPYLPRSDRKIKVRTPSWVKHGPKT